MLLFTFANVRESGQFNFVSSNIPICRSIVTCMVNGSGFDQGMLGAIVEKPAEGQTNFSKTRSLCLLKALGVCACAGERCGRGFR